MDSARLQPAFLGGLVIGVLSGLPLISAGNCCCCLWIIGGGALAVYLRQQTLPQSIDAAEGALIGLMAGAIGGVLATLIAIPVNMIFGDLQRDWMQSIMSGNSDMPPEVRDAMEKMASGGTMMAFTAAYNLITGVVFGLLGGLLGVAVFKKKVPPQAPTVIPHDPGVAL